MTLQNLFKRIYLGLIIKLNPYKYMQIIGINLKGDVHLYAAKVGMFGTEPWLISIGDNVHITANCEFITHDGGTLILRDKVPDLELTFPINIGNNVYIGYGSTILPGVNIGDNVIVGAGSIVNKDLPSNAVYAGVPCKFIKTIDEYLEKAQKRSLKFGHLKGLEKELELKKYYHIDV